MAYEIGIWGHDFIIGLQSLIDSRVCPSNIGLDLNRYTVELFGNSTLSLNDRTTLHSIDCQLSGKDCVLLEIGSFDLCDPSLSPEQFALNIISYATFLRIGMNVKKVAVLQILRRRVEPYAGYNERVIHTNVAIQTAMACAGQNVYFWKHRGFWNCPDDIYSADGFNLSVNVGYKKYIRSIRDCIIRVLNW